MNRLSYKLPDALASAVKSNLEDWRSGDKVRRLWQRDASLWTGTDEASWLGWLDVTKEQIANLSQLQLWPAKPKRAALPTFFCWAWAVRVSARKFWRETFGQTRRVPKTSRP